VVGFREEKISTKYCSGISRFEVLKEKEKISTKYGRRLKSGVLKNVRGDGENFYEIRTEEKEEKGLHSFRLHIKKDGYKCAKSISLPIG
jgi:heterodisulfide reductase subunit A-like polyferredoxin